MAWQATLTNATLNGTGELMTLFVHITDGINSTDVELTYQIADPAVNVQRIRNDISHFANGLGKWPYVQSKIGQVIATGGAG